MESWAAIPLTAVADTTQPIVQLYPSWAPSGSATPGTLGQTILHPAGGTLGSVQVETDGTNGGTIQVYDINGQDITGCDVSAGAPATLPPITATQITAAINLGKAKLIYEMNFTSAVGATTAVSYVGRGFMHGLAARYIGPVAATCKLNLQIAGGYYAGVAIG